MTPTLPAHFCFFLRFSILVFRRVKATLGTASNRFFPEIPNNLIEIIETITQIYFGCANRFFFFVSSDFRFSDRGFRGNKFIYRRAHLFLSEGLTIFLRTIFRL